MMCAKPIAALPFVLCSGLADACDTFSISGRVADQRYGGDTWIGVFRDPVADGAAPVESTWVEEGEFELEAPCAESVTLLAMRKGAVPVKMRILGSAPTVVDLRFAPGLSLTGSVRSDENLPIGGARVSVTRVDETEVRLPESLTTWTSAKDGAFVADGLVPGTYRVEASADGHMPAESVDVVVGKGSRNPVDLRLPRAFYIAGRVVNTSGLAVAGAEIHAAGTPGASDSEGAFRIGPFGKGQRVYVYARVDRSRSAGAEVLVPMHDLVLTLDHAVEIRGSVSSAFTGELLDDFALSAYVDDESWSFLQFRDAAGELSAGVSAHTRQVVISAPGFAPWRTGVVFDSGGGEHDFGNIALETERIVTGRVLDAATRLPVRAWVRRWFDMRDFRSSLPFDVASRLVSTTWTEADGRFRLSGLPQDNVHVETARPGYAAAVVEVPAGMDHIEIEMAAIAATIEGMLVSDEGTPAKGEVLLAKVGGAAESRRVENGRFTFEIAARANDLYRLSVRSVMGRVEDRQLTIRHDNESVTGIRLVVRRLGRVSGLLAGLGAAETASLVVVDQSGRWVQHSPRSFQTGPYSVQGVPEGRFTLRARTTSGREIAKEFESDGRGETGVDLVFAGDSTLSGVVTAGGRPLPRIEVEATPRDDASTSGKVTTTSNGAYAIDGLDDGQYVVRLRGRSFGVELSGDTYYDVELGPFSISGTVRAESPVLGAVVTATSAGAVSGGEDTVDSRGSFRIDGLDEGEYTIRVSHTGYQEVSRTVYLGSAIENLDVRLSPTDGQ